MTMRKFARIDDGLVAELLTTDGDITAMFSPALIWIDVSNGPAVAEGWRYDGTNFLPPAPVPAAPTGPTIADLQAQIAALAAELAALSTVAKT
jgi:hypothetical protein